MPEFWTPEEDDTLVHLVALRTKPQQIAKRIGRPYKNVLNRIARLKERLRAKPSSTGGYIFNPVPGVLVHRTFED